jgi:hypothetical protein
MTGDRLADVLDEGTLPKSRQGENLPKPRISRIAAGTATASEW